MSGNPHFGKRLKAALKEAGITQLEAARRLGLNKDTITNYVKGRIPRQNVLEQLATLCNVSPEWLLFGREPSPIINYVEAGPDFARRFADCLKESGLDLPALARLSGVDQVALEAAVDGRLPDAVTLCRLARTLGVTAEWLVTGEGPSPVQPARPDALARIMAAIAAMDKHDLTSFLEGGMPPEIFLANVSRLSGLPPRVVRQSLGQGAMFSTGEEAVSTIYPPPPPKTAEFYRILSERRK